MKGTHDNLNIYMREIARTPLLTREEERELGYRTLQGDSAARDRMIRSNLRLVVKIAKDYSNYGLPLADLIAEGNVGLMKAVERFHPDKGAKFSTYGAWWIKQCIKRALANQGKTIRMPVHAIEKVSKLRRIHTQLFEELGREPTIEEIAKEAELDPAKASMLLEAAIRPVSLDAPVGDEGDSASHGELIADVSATAPDHELFHQDLLDRLDQLMEPLEKRERDIIVKRFGLNGKPARTLEQVGKEFGVTRERIRQLQNVAILKMRQSLERMEDPSVQALEGVMDKFRDGVSEPDLELAEAS